MLVVVPSMGSVTSVLLVAVKCFWKNQFLRVQEHFITTLGTI